MRIARVIGKVTLNKRMAEILPGSYLVVRPFNRGMLGRAEASKRDISGSPTRCVALGVPSRSEPPNKGSEDETVVLFDPLAAREGDLVGMVEGREASVPFHPAKVPYDAYNACILDELDFQPVLEVPKK